MTIGTNVQDTAVEGLKVAFRDFQELIDKKLEIVDKTGETSKELEEKISKVQERIEVFDGIKTRLEKLEVLANRPIKPGEVPDEITEAQEQHKEAFELYIKNPRNPQFESNLYREEEKALQSKALIGWTDAKQVSTTTPSAGGYAVPTVIGREVESKLRDATLMRQLATVRTVSTPKYSELVTLRTETYGWVGESDTRSPTAAPTLGSCEPTFGMIYSYPSAYEESLDDMFFNVQDWLVEHIVDSHSWGEGVAFMTGDGTKKPTGLLDGTPVTTEDGSRAYGVLQYIPSGDANGFPPNVPPPTSPSSNPVDPFIDMISALKAQYRQRAVWLVNRKTAGEMRKFQDTQGRKMWEQSLSAGMPSLFLGYPVLEDDTVPDIAANAFPVILGDFGGYLIANLVGLRITIDNNITAPGTVNWYIRRRVGGKLKNDDRFKLMKISTT